jgi:hypothetical protein
VAAVVRDGRVPGAAALQLAGGAPLLRPEEQVLAGMPAGWRDWQLARNLAFKTAGQAARGDPGVHPARGCLYVSC